MDRPLNILVLTNRDSDNIGDIFIEASVIGLIRAAMKNLGYAADQFKVNSRAAGFIPKAYVASELGGAPKVELLESARKSISDADLIVFGGAPLFNYAYQIFYMRTIITIRLAEEYGVPVLFSSIGVEPFDPTNPKCLQLQEALASPVVRQATTRDNVPALQEFMAKNPAASAAFACDPAVFAGPIFKHLVPNRDGKTKTIGLVPTRAGIFKDNRIDFDGQDGQAKFWTDTIALLVEKGYDYKIFTTGHFTDEIFVDTLVRSGRVPASKVQFNTNSLEELAGAIGSCDGIIAFRLHASIVSYALKVPAIGLSWNFKVPGFYDSVGLGERALDVEEWRSDTVVSALEVAIRRGVEHDTEYMMTVYRSLFEGLRGVFRPAAEVRPYEYAELVEHHLSPYPGTTQKQYRERVRIKLRRTYETWQGLRQSLDRSQVPTQMVWDDLASATADRDRLKVQIATARSGEVQMKAERDGMKAELSTALSKEAEMKAQASAARSKVAELKSSFSWRITAPLRSAARAGKLVVRLLRR